MNSRSCMSLVEYICLLANGGYDVELLKYSDKYVKKYIAIKMDESNFSADHASLEEWNSVLLAFGVNKEDSPERARCALMQTLNT